MITDSWEASSTFLSRVLTAAFARAGRTDGDSFTIPAPYRLALLHRPGAP